MTITDHRFTGKTEEFYIVFTEGHHFLKPLLKENFSHIYVIAKDTHNWMILDPLKAYLRWEIAPCLITDDLPRHLPVYGSTVLKLKFCQRSTRRQYGYFGLLNCVTWARYILGLRVRALTPYQLYKKLVTMNPCQLGQEGLISVKRIM